MLLVIPMYSQQGEYYIKEGRSKSLHYGRYIEDFGGSVYIGSMNLPSIGSEMIGGFECTIWNFYFDYTGNFMYFMILLYLIIQLGNGNFLDN